MGSEDASLGSSRKGHGGRRTTQRRSGDVQYDFIIKVVGAKFPADYPTAPNYRYQVRWKRGDKLSGKTAHLPYDSSGSVTWDYETRFTSTIQRKDANKLHKKIMNFMLTEYRPREGGKHDKKSWEGGFNLATSIGSVNLGHAVTDVTHDVCCGKGAGIELRIIVSGTPRETSNQDADLVTDIPMTDVGCLSNQDNEPHTELSLDDEDDDDNDSNHTPTPQPRATTPPLGRPPLGAVVPMKEHIKLAEENRSLKEELEKLAKELKKSSSETQKKTQKLDDTKEDCKKYLMYIDDLEARLAMAKDAGKAAPASQQDDTAEVEILLLVHGLLLTPVSKVTGLQDGAIMKALSRWGGFARVNNPGSQPNSFLVNTLTVIEDALESLPDPTPVPSQGVISWVNCVYRMLLAIAEEWPHCKVAQKLGGCSSSYKSGDFASHVFSSLSIAPLLDGEYPLLLVTRKDGMPNLDITRSWQQCEPVDEGIVLGFTTHLLCSLQKGLCKLIEGCLIEIEANISGVLDCKIGGEAKIVQTIQTSYAVMHSMGCHHSIVEAAVRQMFNHMDRVLFNSLLRDGCYCADECVLSYKSVIAALERWGKEVKVGGCLPITRQTCDFVLLRGGTLDDPSLWSAVQPEHLQVVLSNIPDTESVLPQTMQQAVSLGRSQPPRPLPVPKHAITLPSLTQNVPPPTWRDAPLPPPLSSHPAFANLLDEPLSAAADPSVLV